jgi:hypothetical protein
MAARGHSAIQIARMLPREVVSVRHIACPLRVRPRPERAKTDWHSHRGLIYQALIHPPHVVGPPRRGWRGCSDHILSDGFLDPVLEALPSSKAKPNVKKRTQSA